MSGLPEEIIEENILTRLPVKSIARFRCVSRNWNLLFRNPSFIRNHLNHANRMNKFNILVTDDATNDNNLYLIDNNVVSSSPSVGHALKIDYPFMSRKYAVQVLGSCDGLVCIAESYRDICIWNPATREYQPVPNTPIKYPSADLETEFYLIAVGFGFDFKNNDYKVVRVVGFEGSEISEARVYSLRSNSWKELGFIPYDFSAGINEGVLLNGVLHWVRPSKLKTSVVVCYNISDETFHHVPLPNNNSIKGLYMPALGIWERKLCVLHRNHTEPPCIHYNDYVDVWTMMDNKWSKHLKITAQITEMFYGRPIQTLQNGEILLEGGPREEEGGGFVSYDHKLEKATAVKIHGFPECFEVVTYIETLVPLNSGTYIGQPQIE